MPEIGTKKLFMHNLPHAYTSERVSSLLTAHRHIKDHSVH